MQYEAVIGLEVHAQLLTQSKMFCPCSAAIFGAQPNTFVCPVCLGMPGVLPTINRKAVEYTVMTALALNCEIPHFSKFDRKNYPYPDLPKSYQISQYDMPLSHDGWLEIQLDGKTKQIGIRRVHLEEDTAKLTHIHRGREAYSLVDFNRSGIPLMEIVSEPDMRSPEEAYQYAAKIRTILRYLGVNSGNMEEGALRFEANISLRPAGSQELGTKVEVKNLNSFRAITSALRYEIERQRKALDAGGTIAQETMGWDEARGVTVPQRTKEFAHDYRYFPEPDLPPLVLDRQWVEEIRTRLPELPDAKRDRFMREYDLSRYDAQVLTAEREVADYFEAVAKEHPNAKAVSNWITGELFRLLKAASQEIGQSPVQPEGLVELLKHLERGTISGSVGKAVFEEMFKTSRTATEIIAEQGLSQLSDREALAQVAQRVLAENPAAVADFLSGKEQALRFLMGQVMKATRGRANPRIVSQMLREELERRGS